MKSRKSIPQSPPGLVSPATNSSNSESNNVTEIKTSKSPTSNSSIDTSTLPSLVSQSIDLNPTADRNTADRPKPSSYEPSSTRSSLASSLSMRPFSQCEPTASHRALAAFVRAGLVHFVVTQNVDGLHLRSGLPRDRLALLHGDFFVQTCERCGAEVR